MQTARLFETACQIPRTSLTTARLLDTVRLLEPPANWRIYGNKNLRNMQVQTSFSAQSAGVIGDYETISFGMEIILKSSRCSELIRETKMATLYIQCFDTYLLVSILGDMHNLN